MNKNIFLAIVAIVSLVFTSCSSEESLISETQNLSLKKTYKVKRDATGAYSLAFDNNTKIDQVLESNDKTRHYLISSSLNKVQDNNSQELLIDNNNLKVGFVDTDTDAKQNILIFDDNITFQKSNVSSKLAGYSIESNQDGTFGLEFDVKNKVDVSFVYNEEISTYEVHLEKGKGGENSFYRTLEKENGEPLKIDFVNHVSNTGAKSSELEMIRKPKIIIDTFSGD